MSPRDLTPEEIEERANVDREILTSGMTVRPEIAALTPEQARQRLEDYFDRLEAEEAGKQHPNHESRQPNQ